MSQSKLRFSIEESVWLKKGQEVAEVLSMSLDPEISVTEEASQVCIKGALILCGKYRTENKEDSQSGDRPFSEGASYRSLTQLNVSEDGATELVHRFPVDITIPSYRVDDSSQVKVEVESFEYELPNSTCIELSASICIYGIKDEKQRLDEPPHEEMDTAVQAVDTEMRSIQQEEKSDIFTPFQFEARQTHVNSSHQNEQKERFEKELMEMRSEKKTAFEFKPQYEAIDDRTMDATFDTLKSIAFSNDDMRNTSPIEEDVPEEFPHDQEEEPLAVNDDAAPENQYESYEHQNEQQDQQYQSYQNPYNYQSGAYNGQYDYSGQQAQSPENQQAYNQQTMYSGYNPENYVQRPYEGQEQQYGEQEYQDEASYEEHSFQQNDDNDDQEPYYAYEEETEQYEDEPAPIREEEPKNENALYLTKMLSGKDDNFSKMKMYILQRGDSLEHICERYDISLNTLMRMNQIQQEELSEGQIIYIPVSSR
jgi:stage VI sporulation protein D